MFKAGKKVSTTDHNGANILVKVIKDVILAIMLAEKTSCIWGKGGRVFFPFCICIKINDFTDTFGPERMVSPQGVKV